jgi:signal transduction histidine kinase
MAAADPRAGARSRWPDGLPLADLGLAGLVAFVVIAATYLVRGRPDALGVALLLACAAPLALRRRDPVVALVLVGAAAFAYDLLDEPAAMYTIPIAIALYAAADAGRRASAVAGLVAIVGGFLAVGMVFGRGHVVDLANAAWFTGWLVASVVLGEVMRSRRAYLEEVERRARDAERTREEEGRRRAGEERMRIARELHDVLAHRISLINVQAGVGAHLLDRDPEQARASLLAIRDTSREALAELRATLGILRQVDEGEPRAPVPGLAELDRLLADLRTAGLDAAVEVQGEPRELPTEVDLAAFRIVQESLTNVVRHANATRVKVGLRYLPEGIDIAVDDDGETATPGRVHEGNGLAGMRERAAALGGAFEAAAAAGGFRVHAWLPTVSG